MKKNHLTRTRRVRVLFPFRFKSFPVFHRQAVDCSRPVDNPHRCWSVWRRADFLFLTFFPKPDTPCPGHLVPVRICSFRKQHPRMPGARKGSMGNGMVQVQDELGRAVDDALG